jgi:coenzyme F420-0:L-glutamate ligase / coenzyme F420-1:gamma-L-glutamate ligase
MSDFNRATEALQFLRSRRSIRQFLPDQVSAETLERILETATWAPSAHNRQPWRFVVLQDREIKLLLMDRMGWKFRQDLQADGIDPEQVEIQIDRSQRRVLGAPVVILLCQDTSPGDAYPDADRQQAEFLMGVQSVALAGGQLLLAAHAEDLGGVWICAPLFAQDIVRQTLDLPASWDPQAFVLLGYPDENPAPRPRLSLAEVARFI